MLTELKSVRASFQMIVPYLTRPEVEDHVNTIRTHMDHAIAFYESLLQLAMVDAQQILHLYTQHQWDAPPLHGPSWT